MPAGTVKFGLGAKGLWRRLDRLRGGPETPSGLVPARPKLVVAVKFFGRYGAGWLGDGLLLSVG